MARKRLIIEMGMGIDQHGQEPTVAAARAVRNAIAIHSFKLSGACRYKGYTNIPKIGILLNLTL